MKTKGIKSNLRAYTMLLMLVVIILMFQLLTGGRLLKPMNVNNLVNQNAYVVILATGMLICILTGGNIDLSVGSVVCLIGACAGKLIVEGKWNSYLGIIVCLLIGIAIGVWQGFWIAYIRIPAFIVTLSGMLVFRGLALLILNGMTIAPFPDDFKMFSTGSLFSTAEKTAFLGYNVNMPAIIIGALVVAVFLAFSITGRMNKARKGYEVEGAVAFWIKNIIISVIAFAFFFIVAQWRGVPSVLILLGVIVLFYSYFTSNTVMGRHIYAIGGNEKAARLSGVKTNWLLFLSYVNMAFLSAVAGLVFAARVDSAYPGAGQSFELDAIGACYLGGASAYGGVGTIGGALIGALIFGVLNNGMSIMGLNSNLQQVVKGLVLLAAVAFDVISKMQISLPKFGKKSATTVAKG